MGRLDGKVAIAQAIKKYGKIDILVNNAGIHCGKSFLDAEDEDWDRINNVNVNGKGVGGFFADGGDGPYAYYGNRQPLSGLPVSVSGIREGD